MKKTRTTKKIINQNKTTKATSYNWKTSNEVFKKVSKSEKFQKVYSEELLRLQLAKQIRDTRTKLKLTQQVVAKRAGMTQSIIARIESGEHSVSLGTLGRISHSLSREIKLV